jgi:hypothetical protein
MPPLPAHSAAGATSLSVGFHSPRRACESPKCVKRHAARRHLSPRYAHVTRLGQGEDGRRAKRRERKGENG